MAAISQTTFSNAFFLDENVCISINISLKFVPNGQINNIPKLFQIMAWCRPGDRPLSETSHYLKQAIIWNWRIYASLILNELN